MSNLKVMQELAQKAHEGQMDKAGKPILGHIARVVAGLPSDADDELKSMAFGHELIEDGFETRDSLLEKGFSLRVIDGIDALARKPGQNLKAYQKQVLGNKDAMIVKDSDLRDNSDLSRIENPTERDHRRTDLYLSFRRKIQQELGKAIYTAPSGVR